MPVRSRLSFALSLAREGGALAALAFRQPEALIVEMKGRRHDPVSDADRAVEDLIRRRIAETFPDDAVLGEERGETGNGGGYLWVVDPIDGTANYVSGIPQWCVAIALVKDGQTLFGVTFDPIADDMMFAARGDGAVTRNGRPLARLAPPASATSGRLAVGASFRCAPEDPPAIIGNLLRAGGMYCNIGSGALMLAYVATGRLLGYVEPHMNAWDCLGGLLMIEEAGGETYPYDVAHAIEEGTFVLGCRPGLLEPVSRWAGKLS